jgi:hypothetical protein
MSASRPFGIRRDLLRIWIESKPWRALNKPFTKNAKRRGAACRRRGTCILFAKPGAERVVPQTEIGIGGFPKNRSFPLTVSSSRLDRFPAAGCPAQ